MEQPYLIEAAMKIYHLTDLNTYLINGDGKLTFYHEQITIPSFMPGADQEDIFYLHKQMLHKDYDLYSYSNKWGLNYLGYSFICKEGSKYAIIIGPYLELTVNVYNLSREYLLNSNESEEIRTFCNQTKLLNVEKTLSFASVLQHFDSMIEKEVSMKHIRSQYNESTLFESVNKESTEKIEVINLRYKVESDFLHAVEQGDKENAMKLIKHKDLLFSFSDRFPSQPLRRVKNLAIVLNTLLRTAAKKSKVPAIILHRISEKYALLIEYSNQLSELKQLYDEMIVEYCEIVKANSLSNYSKVTQQVIEYLMTNYDQQINIEELAELCFTHRSHLSRKFKQETGTTITMYQQKIRMEKAKYLLKHEKMSIEEIAWTVGYEDSSYFTRVFKKELGITPSQFLKKLATQQ
ncbi:AraC-like DNA-binding protein [Evansella vedderi]|uniref:AraC-like DNA-binding protein n=1 Tax=Evansella vedderi TaxID=38282 RepID=A0ABU0A2X6_9BACI|nr:AraC family transcriptional regulator [Evansella vedderi]MDQ0256705.1 AraC-like DNA-binding protein [Evansella vedderi]